MVTEEIGLNAHLEAAGIEVVETDLGEYIIQIRGEAPSHIIAPVIHLTRKRSPRISSATHRGLAPIARSARAELVAEARACCAKNSLPPMSASPAPIS